MTHEEYDQYRKKINDFLEDQDKIKEQYTHKGVQTKNESLDFFGNNVIQPLTLCDSTILFLIFSLAEKKSASDKKQIQKMQLLTAYLQGIDISTNLILEGNYIKASATLKQDFEIIVRLNEIHNNKAKDGRTPNAQNGPVTYKEMYGYLNDLAHISKDSIMNFALKHKTKNSNGVSPVKKINKSIAHRLMAYNAAVKVEIFRQCLNLYLDLAGQDDTHKQSLVYYTVVIDIYSRIGMLSHSNEQTDNQ